VWLTLLQANLWLAMPLPLLILMHQPRSKSLLVLELRRPHHGVLLIFSKAFVGIKSTLMGLFGMGILL
jgi:hypothetical protein